MAIQTVNYLSCSRLNCGCCGSTVVLCVDPTIVAPKFCPDAETEQPVQYSFIYAEVCGEKQVSNVCGAPQWMYTFKFDDDQLLDGTVLTSTVITGIICDKCLVTWTQDLVGEEVKLVTDIETGVQSLVSQHGCSYPIALTELSAQYLAIHATVNFTQNTGGVGFTDLLSYTVPANTLAAGRRILFTAWGAYGANEAIQLRVLFGNEIIFLNVRTPIAVSLPDNQWKLSGQILYSTVLATLCEVSFLTDETSALEPLTDLNINEFAIDETVSNDLIIQTQATTAGVVFQYGLVVDRILAP